MINPTKPIRIGAILLLLLLGAFNTLIAQIGNGPGQLVIKKAQVVEIASQKPVSWVNYSIIDTNTKEIIHSGQTDKRGRFYLELSLGPVYQLELTCQDHYKTNILIDTRTNLKGDTDIIQHNLKDILIVHQKTKFYDLPSTENKEDPSRREIEDVVDYEKRKKELLENAPILTFEYNPETQSFQATDSSFVSFSIQARHYLYQSP